MIIRKCTKCNEEKHANLDNFPPHKPGKYGLHSWCIPCKKMVDKERRSRPDQKARQKEWRDRNKDKVRAYNAAYRETGYKSTEDAARWRGKNLERARQIDSEKTRRWRAEKPWYNLKCRVSARVNSMLKNGKGNKTTSELLGYSMEDLRKHLESKFTEGMSWDVFLCGEIELDHIIPVSHFKAESYDAPAFKKCWSLENLQPLWKEDNRRKGNKLEY